MSFAAAIEIHPSDPLDLLGSKRIAGGDLIPNTYFYAVLNFPARAGLIRFFEKTSSFTVTDDDGL